MSHQRPTQGVSAKRLTGTRKPVAVFHPDSVQRAEIKRGYHFVSCKMKSSTKLLRSPKEMPRGESILAAASTRSSRRPRASRTSGPRPDRSISLSSCASPTRTIADKGASRATSMFPRRGVSSTKQRVDDLEILNRPSRTVRWNGSSFGGTRASAKKNCPGTLTDPGHWPCAGTPTPAPGCWPVRVT